MALKYRSEPGVKKDEALLGTYSRQQVAFVRVVWFYILSYL